MQLQTNIPGPLSIQWAERRQNAVPRGTQSGAPVFIAQTASAVLRDVDGNSFLDFAGDTECMLEC